MESTQACTPTNNLPFRTELGPLFARFWSSTLAPLMSFYHLKHPLQVQLMKREEVAGDGRLQTGATVWHTSEFQTFRLTGFLRMVSLVEKLLAVVSVPAGLSRFVDATSSLIPPSCSCSSQPCKSLQELSCSFPTAP